MPDFQRTDVGTIPHGHRRPHAVALSHTAASSSRNSPADRTRQRRDWHSRRPVVGAAADADRGRLDVEELHVHTTADVNPGSRAFPDHRPTRSRSTRTSAGPAGARARRPLDHLSELAGRCLHANGDSERLRTHTRRNDWLRAQTRPLLSVAFG